jgi:hypothetical protein
MMTHRRRRLNQRRHHAPAPYARSRKLRWLAIDDSAITFSRHPRHVRCGDVPRAADRGYIKEGFAADLVA